MLDAERTVAVLKGGRVKYLNVGGKYTVTCSKHESVTIPDHKGHTVEYIIADGFNENVGIDTHLDGANVKMIITADMTHGHGHHYGYTTLSKGEDKAVTKLQGYVSTDKQGQTSSMTGTWIKAHGGEGRYQGVMGSGTYKGKMLGKDKFELEWEGDMQVFESEEGEFE